MLLYMHVWGCEWECASTDFGHKRAFRLTAYFNLFNCADSMGNLELSCKQSTRPQAISSQAAFIACASRFGCMQFRPLAHPRVRTWLDSSKIFFYPPFFLCMKSYEAMDIISKNKCPTCWLLIKAIKNHICRQNSIRRIKGIIRYGVTGYNQHRHHTQQNPTRGLPNRSILL